jgi:iron(III) transport system ATP-binding protein
MYITLEGLRFSYDAKTLIENFTVSIDQGDVVAIVGKSGAGKSTLLRLIAGLEKPSQGRLCLEGLCLFDENTFVSADKRHIGLVFQDYTLFPHLTVRQNIGFGLSHVKRGQRKAVVDRFVKMVELEADADKYPYECSGGMQQRVAIARALANEPKLLLLDEPFSNLDASLKERLQREMVSWFKQTGVTVILVTHDRSDVDALADRIIDLDQKK